MNARSFAAGINCSLLIVTLIVTVAAATPPAHADNHAWTGGHKKPAGELVKVVREATRRFRDVRIAEAEGYQLHFGCVSSPDRGAMGLHYVNMTLVGDGILQPDRPEIIIYEPLPNGRLRLIGADYLVLSEAWHANNAGPPELMGQLLHLFLSPNRFGLPHFYTLHVWAWKRNPFGAYVNSGTPGCRARPSTARRTEGDATMETSAPRTGIGTVRQGRAPYRTFVFLFSIACYGAFLIVFLYLLAFLGNLQVTVLADIVPALRDWVPRSIDLGHDMGSLGAAIGIDLGLISLCGRRSSSLLRLSLITAARLLGRYDHAQGRAATP